MRTTGNMAVLAVTESELLVLAAVPYGACYFTHLCREGHFAHPPYSPLSRSYDFLWLGCLLLALLTAVLGGFRRRWWIAAGVSFLVMSRSVANHGGLLGPIEAIVLAALVLVCVAERRHLPR